MRDNQRTRLPSMALTGALLAALLTWQCGGGSAATDEADLDQDGVLAAHDDCPYEAEDPDGFEDYDGCLDPDNDGDGVADAYDHCPEAGEDVDGWLDADGCPDSDNDQDGFADARDLCPNEAEDMDGLRDNDGCPEANDTDGDGMVAELDQCPQQPENFNGLLDHDGCPDRVEVVRPQVCEEHRVSQQVYFEPGSAVLDATARAELDELAGILLRDTAIERVLVQGHSDSREQDNVGASVELSEQRAEAIRDYLVARGVSPSILVTQGYGYERPMANNSDVDGRAQNRRVSFEVVEPIGCT